MRYKIVFLNGLDGNCSIQDTDAKIPTFYNDLSYTYSAVKPLCELLNEQDEEIKSLRFDKKQLHNAMSNETVRHREFKHKVFETIDNHIAQYEFEEEYNKLKGHSIGESESYVKAMALRLLREELVEWV